MFQHFHRLDIDSEDETGAAADGEWVSVGDDHGSGFAGKKRKAPEKKSGAGAASAKSTSSANKFAR